MKFTFLSLFIALSSASADISVSIFADEAGAPLSYSENGVAKGLYVDIVTEAAKLIPGYKVKIFPIPWKRGLHDLEQGKFFALLPPYKMLSRDYIDPYSTAILNEEVAFFCRDDVATKLKSPYQFPESFKKLKIGVTSGYSLGEKFDAAVKSEIIFVDYAKDTKANILKMERRRIDCSATNEFNYYWALRQIKLENTEDPFKKLKFSKTFTISKETGHIGYSKTFVAPYKQDFISKMNLAIEELKASGKIEKLSEKYRE